MFLYYVLLCLVGLNKVDKIGSKKRKMQHYSSHVPSQYFSLSLYLYLHFYGSSSSQTKSLQKITTPCFFSFFFIQDHQKPQMSPPYFHNCLFGLDMTVQVTIRLHIESNCSKTISEYQAAWSSKFCGSYEVD